MNEEEKQQQINSLNRQITATDTKMRKYENMKMQIEKSIDNLGDAISNIKEAGEELGYAYTSEEASKKIEELQDIETQIEETQTILKNALTEATTQYEELSKKKERIFGPKKLVIKRTQLFNMKHIKKNQNKGEEKYC